MSESTSSQVSLEQRVEATIEETAGVLKQAIHICNRTHSWLELWEVGLRLSAIRLSVSTCLDLTHRCEQSFHQRGWELSLDTASIPGQATANHKDSAIALAAKWTEKRLRSVVKREIQVKTEPKWKLDSAEQAATLITALKSSLDQLCEVEFKVRRALLKCPKEEHDATQIISRVNELSETLVKNNRDTHLSDHEETRRAFELVHEARLLKRLCAHLEGRPGTYQADLISETFSMSEVEWYQYALQQASLTSTYEGVYTNSLEREVSSFESAVSEYISLSQTISNERFLGELLPKVWRCLLWGGELKVTIRVAPIQHTSALVERCAHSRDQLRALITSQLETITAEQFIEHFTELSWDLLYYASDLMSEMDHTTINRSVFRLECVHTDLEWFLSWSKVTEAEEVNHEHFLAGMKRLKKQLHWVSVELQEKRLQGRLEGIFGQKFVTRFEQLLFFLIFLVLGLLLYEFAAVPHEDLETRRILALIDTGICAIFLSEFFTKLALVDKRWFYFKRRWFIDLLPSIPFVYFTDYLFAEYMMAGRSAKLVRLSRFARYIRIIRPFVRVIRLISFTLRGMDRLIRRYSQWLNHNLVFFEPSQSIYHRPKRSLFDQANVVYARSLSLSRQLAAQLSAEELAPLMPTYLLSLSAHLSDESAPLSQQQLEGDISEIRQREVPVEHAIHTLIHLQGAELEAHLGYNFPKRLYSIVGLFDLPVINRIPLLSDVLVKRRHSTASEFAAWWIRGFGKFLEAIMSLGYWFADLYGVVTGPKLIDRVGSTLVRSFERPAKRLLIFGGLLITLQILVSALEITFLDHVVSGLQKFVGLPMIVIGSICFVPLILGRWMKQIADQAEELYRLTAEAQFINLLKDVKERHALIDLELIYDRVVFAEEQMWGLVDQDRRDERRRHFVHQSAAELKRPLLVIGPNAEGEELVQEPELISKMFTPPPMRSSSNENIALTPEHDLYWLDRRLELLYRDYLDGAILHHSDIKTTEQLLGNLALRSLFDYKLNLTPQERKDIERLDLGTHRSLIGPFMWFSLITQSVSQAAAQLVIDYNRYVIPKRQVKHALPEARELFHDWLEHKKGRGFSYAELEERKRNQPPFNTTDLNVLQILASKENHIEEMQVRFGAEVVELLEQDQKKLIRGVFSSYPLHRLPKPLRTLNPYLLYNEFIQGGKLFTLPFRLIGLVFKTIGLGVRWTKEKIDEIRFPDKIRTEVIPQKDFVVALRKIHRMRKPIFMKLLQLRAQIDFAYLGLTVEGIDPISHGDEAPHIEQDLDLINAIEVERLPIQDLIESTQSTLRELSEYLSIRGYSGESLKVRLAKDFPELVDRDSEVSRALITAYLADFKGIQSYLQTKIKLAELVEDSLNGLPNTPFKLHKRVLSSASRATKRLVHRGEDRERIGFEMFWRQLEHVERSEEQLKICWERYLSEARDLQPLLIRFAAEGLPKEDSILEEVIRTTPMWTDELVALRCIQTFSLMDIENYRRYIWSVGSYQEDHIKEDT